MGNLDEKVLKSALGEHRLNPDEQRCYLGTFAERVVLAILLENTRKPEVQEHFESVLTTLLKKYDALAVKISPELANDVQMFYMKIGQKHHLQVTIVNETSAKSPYGLIVHSDKAENLDETLFCKLYPDYLDHVEETKKKSFWSKWLKK